MCSNQAGHPGGDRPGPQHDRRARGAARPGPGRQSECGRRRHGRDRRTAAWCHGHGDEHSERDFAGAHHRGGGPLPGSGAAARAVRHRCRALWICAGPTVPDPVGRSRCDHRFPAHGRGAAGERDRHRRGAGHRGFEVPAVLDRSARAVADPAEPRSQFPGARAADAGRWARQQPGAVFQSHEVRRRGGSA